MFKPSVIVSAILLAVSFSAVNAVPAALDSRAAIGFFCGASTTCT
ncbi:hypothetical protein D9619_007680 [Psilocybe cf. subviscida]|uniref:Uncharacterized protein n=1 Tax=Psilocybe cf. subviscida TaxID=2480587 RepID=A0A8H5AU18_9AGAR|nr:hypothetical protein D9619_007680 [Psilocybe cf. subviscida]